MKDQKLAATILAACISLPCVSLPCVSLPCVSLAQESAARISDAGKDSLWTRDGLDWPSFLGPDRNGISAETGHRFDWSDHSPTIVWSQRVGEGYGIGSVAGGRYFHFDRQQDNARVRALNAETGESLWDFTYATGYADMYGFDGGPRSSPVVDGDRIYVYGVEGMLYCLNAKTGERIWDVDTTQRFGVIQNFFGVGSTPLIHNDLLIVMVGGSPSDSQDVPSGRLAEVKPNGNAIVAFDKMTGEVKYETINDLASYASPVVAKLDGKLTGLAFLRSGLYAFNPDNGESGFEFPFRARKLESVNASTPVVAESRILITESYGPGAAWLQVSNGKLQTVWADDGGRDRALACHWNTPVIVDGYAYASSGESQSTALLRCVRLSDGKVMWEQPGLTRCSLISVEEHLICLAEDGRLFNFKPDPEALRVHGEISAKEFRLVHPCWANPVVSHGFLYVRGKSKVWCLDIRQP